MEDQYDLIKQLMAIVNTDMHKASEASVIKCLDMYVKLMSNIDAYPDEQRYKRIKKKSKLVTDAMSVSGGMDLMYKIGWVVRVQEFEEWIVWEGKSSVLQAALVWAKEKIKAIQEKSVNASASAKAAEKKEEEYVENLKRALDMERKERYQQQHGNSS